MELNERKMRILRAVVDDYITTAMPVGSRTLMKKYISELSAATIRNEMSDLEELGFLDSPHTSAGRIPSYKAYRYYVDQIMSLGDLTNDEGDIIRKYFAHRLGEVEDVIQNAAKAVSELTDYASVVIAPQNEESVLRHIQLVPVTAGAALVVVVTDTAILKDSIIRVPQGMSADELSSISSALSHRFSGRPLKELRSYAVQDLRAEFGEEERFFAELTGALSKAAGREAKAIVVDGALNIFHHPEYAMDTEKAQSFLMALNSRDKLYDMLHKATQWKFTISIGPENEYNALKDMSVVTATYSIGDQALGSVGVIGPTRMDYTRVLRILSFMGKSVGEMLTGIIDTDNNSGKG